MRFVAGRVERLEMSFRKEEWIYGVNRRRVGRMWLGICWCLWKGFDHNDQVIVMVRKE
jgi:hypothetical protein